MNHSLKIQAKDSSSSSRSGAKEPAGFWDSFDSFSEEESMGDTNSDILMVLNCGLEGCFNKPTHRCSCNSAIVLCSDHYSRHVLQLSLIHI